MRKSFAIWLALPAASGTSFQQRWKLTSWVSSNVMTPWALHRVVCTFFETGKTCKKLKTFRIQDT